MNKKLYILLVFIALFGSYLRILRKDEYSLKNANVFLCVDSYHHMRRSEWISENYPRMLYNDQYLNYPDDGPIHWPPGYDYFLGTIHKVLKSLNLSQLQLEKTISYVNPFLAFFVILLVFQLASMLYGIFPAFLSALFISVSPAHILYSRYGNMDHHNAITLAILLISIFLFKAFQKDAKRTVKWGTGLVIGFSQLIHSVFAHSNIILVCILGLLFVYSRFKKVAREKDLYKTFEDIFLVSTLLTFLFSLHTPPGRAFQMRFEQLSFFHVLIPFVGYIFTQILLFKDYKLKKAKIHMAISGLSFILLIYLLIGTDVLATLFKGVHLVTGGWIYVLPDEAASLFKFGLKFTVYNFSFLIFAVPFYLAFTFFKNVKYLDERAQLLVLLIYGSIIGSMGVFQYTFSPNTAIFISIFAVGFIAYLSNMLVEKIKYKHLKNKYALIAGLFIICIGNVFYSSIKNLMIPPSTSAINVRARRIDMDLMARYIRKITPPTSGFFSDNIKPEYSIYAHKDLAHALNYRARRPAMVNSIGMLSYFAEHHKDFARFELSSDFNESKKILEKYKSRYAIISPLISKELKYYSRVLSIPYSDFYTSGEGSKKYTYDDLTRYKKPGRYTDKYFSTVNTRLFLYDGSSFYRNNKLYTEIPFLRLLYESRGALYYSRNQNVSKFKLYQVVKGAVLKGRAQNNTIVKAHIKMKTNVGREFTYTATKRAEEDGTWEIVFPYPTEVNPLIVVTPIGKIQIEIGDQKSLIEISEKDILEGAIITVS